MTRKKSATAVLSLWLLILSASAAESAEPEPDPLGRNTVTISGNVDIPGVILQGLPGRPVSDAGGSYSVAVPYGWAGTVMPAKEGYAFDPPRRTYEKVASDQRNQNYFSRLVFYTISGNAGLPGVTMEGLPDDPIADADGYYSTTVEHGWTGSVVPKKDDRTFNPASKRYAAVTKDLTDEDYIPRTVIISDQIVFGTEPIADVVITAEPGGYTAATDSQGWYHIEVPYGWSGELDLSKPGFEFAPDNIPFSKVATDVNVGEPPSPPELEPFPPDLSGVRSYRPPTGRVDDVLVIPSTTALPDEFAQTSEDIRVMQQILRDTLSEPRMILGVLYDYGDFLGARGRRNDAFYLQGYGVLFVVEVDFPLSPAGPQKTEPNSQQVAPIDPVWQRARQRLYSPRDGRYPSGAQPNLRDQMSFEQFKRDLIGTLKHAANIRHVDPNENIVLTVIGQAPEGGPPMSAPSRGGFSGGANGWFEGGSYSYSGGSFGAGGGNSYADSRSYVRGTGRGQTVRRTPSAFGTSAATVLTIRARKADVNAYAGGELEREQFEESVKVFAY